MASGDSRPAAKQAVTLRSVAPAFTLGNVIGPARLAPRPGPIAINRLDAARSLKDNGSSPLCVGLVRGQRQLRIDCGLHRFNGWTPEPFLSQRMRGHVNRAQHLEDVRERCINRIGGNHTIQETGEDGIIGLIHFSERNGAAEPGGMNAAARKLNRKSRRGECRWRLRSNPCDAHPMRRGGHRTPATEMFPSEKHVPPGHLPSAWETT